jgi:hypothetical protein
MASLPDQPPDAVQAVAFVDDQDSVEAEPLATVLGLALRLTVAVGIALTVTVADWEALPPVPVQVKVKVAVLVRAPVDWTPLTALLPDQPPEAAHEVALTDDHVSVALPPFETALGPTLRLTVGAGALTETVTDCAALPAPGPAPLQVSV